MSLKAKPIATELTPRPATRSPGLSEGSTIVAASRKPSRITDPLHEAAEHVAQILAVAAAGAVLDEAHDGDADAVEHRHHDEGDDDVRQHADGGVEPAVDPLARRAEVEIDALGEVLQPARFGRGSGLCCHIFPS